MSDSVEDKIVRFIAARGSEGASSEELAKAFLSLASAPPALCDRLIGNVLANDPRVVHREDGMWVLPKGSSAATREGEFTVIETLDLAAGQGRMTVEWAGIRVDAQGRTGDTRGSPVQPRTWPPGAVAPKHLQGQLGSAPSPADALSAATDLARGSTIVSFRPGPFQFNLFRALESRGEAREQLFLTKLGRELLGKPVRSPEDLAAWLRITARECETAEERARFAAEILSAMVAMKDELGLGKPDEWPERQQPQREAVDFSRYEFDRAFLQGLPESSGIYIMHDANGRPIYVGKAKNLKQRVGSYFQAKVRRDEKTENIIEAVSMISIKQSGSELAALLDEFRAIREFQPRINIQFDVHDRPAVSKAPKRKWILVLPAPVEDSAEVVLLHGERAMWRDVVPRDDPTALRPIIEEFFFADEPPQAESETETEELCIAWTWLERNRDKVNVLDVDQAGGLQGTLALLGRYLGEDASGGRVFHV